MGLAAGLSEEQLNGLGAWRDNALFTERQRALLAYAEAMLSPDGVDDQAYRGVSRFFGEREIVELTLNAAFYTAVAQFTRTLRVEHDAEGHSGRYGLDEPQRHRDTEN
jgi:alkylhydroperoxidase family enzyme